MKVYSSITMCLLATSINAWLLNAAEPSVSAQIGSAPIVSAPITSLAFSSDNQQLLAASQSGISIYQWPELKRLRQQPIPFSHAYDLQFSSDGKLLAVAGGSPSESGTVLLYSWPELKLKETLNLHDDVIYQVNFTTNNKRTLLLTASMDRSIGSYDVTQQKLLRRVQGHSKGVLSIISLPHSKHFISAGLDQTIRVWSSENLAEKPEPLRSFNQHTESVLKLAVRPQQAETPLPIIASVSKDKTMRLWQPTIGRMVRFVRFESVPLNVAWSTSGDQIFVTCTDGTIKIIDPETMKILHNIPVSNDWLSAITVASDGSSLAVGGSNGLIKRIALEFE